MPRVSGGRCASTRGRTGAQSPGHSDQKKHCGVAGVLSECALRKFAAVGIIRRHQLARPPWWLPWWTPTLCTLRVCGSCTYVAGCLAVTDAAFAHLRDICTIDMSYCNQHTITGAAIAHLRASSAWACGAAARPPSQTPPLRTCGTCSYAEHVLLEAAHRGCLCALEGRPHVACGESRALYPPIGAHCGAQKCKKYRTWESLGVVVVYHQLTQNLQMITLNSR